MSPTGPPHDAARAVGRPGGRGPVAVSPPQLARPAHGNGASRARADHSLGASIEPAAASAVEPAEPPADDLELVISEPSRVVNLSVLAAQAGAGGAQASAQLPRLRPAAGLGRGTGSPDAVGADAVIAAAAGLSAVAELTPAPNAAQRAGERPRRSGLAWITGGVLVLVAAAGVLVFLLATGEPRDETAAAGVRNRSFESLGMSVSASGQRGPDGVATPRPGDDPAGRSAGSSASKPAAPARPRGRAGDRAGDPARARPPSVKTPADPRAGNGKTEKRPGRDAEPLRRLSPQDVIRVSTRNSIGSKRCYERALKKDPFLKVAKIEISLSVNTAGEVSSVSLSSHADTELGRCLASRIKGWRFPPSSNGIRTEIPIVFEQR